MPVSGRELIRELEQAGYIVKRINGSHYVMAKGRSIVIVPNHRTDLPRGTEMAIRKLTGVRK